MRNRALYLQHMLWFFAACSCSTTFPADVSTQLEEGSSCAPLRGPAATTPKVDVAAPGCSEPTDDAGVDGHARGFGYPIGTDAVPAHMAYLTFDDGPSDWTNEFLDVLQRYSVHATFFVTSEQLKGSVGLRGSYVDSRGVTQVYERLVKREVDEGHIIANHTLNHPDLGVMHDEQVMSEFDQNELQINAGLLRAGAKPQNLSLLRPPYGSPWFSGPSETTAPLGAQKQVAERIARHGINVLWNVDSSDSQEWALDESYSRTIHEQPKAGAPSFRDKVQRIKDTVLTSDQVMRGQGIVVLMHDTHPTTLAALPDMIQGLLDMGYAFGTMEEYVQTRWQRSSLELTPGPPRNTACIAQRDWGCLAGAKAEVCGRMWRAYAAVGGDVRLGAALRAQSRDPSTGIVSQAFERGVLELHPENPAPCNVVIKGSTP